MESKVYPYTWEVLWKRFLSNLVSLSISSPPLPALTEECVQTGKKLGHERLGYNPDLQYLQEI